MSGRPDEGSGGNAPKGDAGTGGQASDGGASGSIGDDGGSSGSSAAGSASCELNTVKDCGACGTSCSLDGALSAACTAGKCDPTCATGFGDCNGDTNNDGCETDLTTATNCGACSKTCSSANATAAACGNGLCQPTCSPNYLDCNQATATAVDDGCETYAGAMSFCGTTCVNAIACAPNEVCNSGVCGAPQGAVVFTVHMTAANQSQRYYDQYQTTPVDLTNATVTARVFAPGATAGTLNLYATDADFTAGPGKVVELATLAEGWTDISVAVGGVSGAFDPSAVTQIRLELAAGTTTASWADPTVIYVDSIVSSNLSINDTFDASSGNVGQSTGLSIPGSTLGWTSAIP